MLAQQGSISDAEISGPIGVNPNTTYNYNVLYYAGASYNWTVSGAATLLSGQGSRSVYIRTASSFSSYQVQCTISKDGCSRTVSMVSFNDGGGPGGFQVTAYPNPTSGDLNVAVSEQDAPKRQTAVLFTASALEDMPEVQYTLYDPLGQEVQTITGLGKATFDTRYLKKGFYTLRVIHDSVTISQRIKVIE